MLALNIAKNKNTVNQKIFFLEMSRNVWFVTGASSGLGLALVKELLAQNYKVAATSRNLQRLTQNVGQELNDQFLPLEVDLLNDDSVKHGVEATVSKFGTIDVLVNNAGHGFRGALEETSIEEGHKLFEDNFFSMHRVLLQVLPIMREKRNGLIYNISSIGALLSLPLSAYYAATKAAVISISECLAAEVEEYNIKVVPVEPGPFQTNFFQPTNLLPPQHELPAYDGVRERRNKSAIGNQQKKDGDPERAAKVFIEISKLDDVPKMLFIGKLARQLAQPKIQLLANECEQWKEYTDRCSFE